MIAEKHEQLRAMADMIKRYDAQQDALRTMEQEISKACREFEKVSGHRGLSMHSIRRTLVHEGMINV